MLAAALKSFSQLPTRPFRAVLLKSLGLTVGLLIALIVAIETVFGALVVLPGWLETTIQWVGGLGLVVASVFLIAPITSLIAGLYLDDIAAEVEKRHYPNDPPGRELPMLTAMGTSLKFGLVVMAVNILALFLLLIPVVNVVAFLAANGYLLGREFFELAAFRHLPQAEAKRLRKANRLRVFVSGLAIAGLVSVPVLNLLTPLFATAFMVHTYKDIAARQARHTQGAAAGSV